jgi:AraC-like DNA-binding protein
MKHWQEVPHKHPFPEIIFVKSGSGSVSIGEHRYDITCGDLVIYNPNVMHTEKSSSDDPLELYFFAVKNIKLETLPENYLLEEGIHEVVATGEQYELFSAYFSNLINESNQEHNQHFSKEMTESITRIVLILTLRLLSRNTEKYLKVNDLYLKAKRYIDERYMQITSLDAICQDVFISKYYLAHLFRQYANQTPFQYIIHRKLDMAKRLLSISDMPVQAIAEHVGYNEATYFCKVFKRYERMSPTAYRQLYQCNGEGSE